MKRSYHITIDDSVLLPSARGGAKPNPCPSLAFYAQEAEGRGVVPVAKRGSNQLQHPPVYCLKVWEEERNEICWQTD